MTAPENRVRLAPKDPACAGALTLWRFRKAPRRLPTWSWRRRQELLSREESLLDGRDEKPD